MKEFGDKLFWCALAIALIGTAFVASAITTIAFDDNDPGDAGL